MWYTLTGNYGNLLPIDYWSNSLTRKSHNRSNISDKSLNKVEVSNCQFNKDEKEEEEEDDKDIESSNLNDNEEYNDDDYDNFYYDSSPNNNNSITLSTSASFASNKHQHQHHLNSYLNDEGFELDSSNDDNDDDNSINNELIMINDDEDDDNVLTAEQVLDEIDTIMTLQEENLINNNNNSKFYLNDNDDDDETTPDSGYCYSILDIEQHQRQHQQQQQQQENKESDLNCCYLKYISTFASHHSVVNIENDNDNPITKPFNNKKTRHQLNAMTLSDLKLLIVDIEQQNEYLSTTLASDRTTNDELQLENETKHTFISLFDKSHKLSKKYPKNQKIVIPYNSEIKYTVKHLEMLNKRKY
jgi:hypothetical protein